MLLSVIALLSCSLAVSLVNADDDDLVIQTKSGKVRGKVMPVMDGEVRFFLGIPYGKPPVGSMRFKRAQPVDSWEGVKETTSYSDSCYQNVDTTFPGGSSILATVFYCTVLSSIRPQLQSLAPETAVFLGVHCEAVTAVMGIVKQHHGHSVWQ